MSFRPFYPLSIILIETCQISHSALCVSQPCRLSSKGQAALARNKRPRVSQGLRICQPETRPRPAPGRGSESLLPQVCSPGDSGLCSAPCGPRWSPPTEHVPLEVTEGVVCVPAFTTPTGCIEVLTQGRDLRPLPAPAAGSAPAMHCLPALAAELRSRLAFFLLCSLDLSFSSLHLSLATSRLLFHLLCLIF